MSQTSLDEVFEFLGIVATRGTWNDNTVQARRTACNKFFDILDPNEKTLEYVRDNLDVIKGRYMNLNKDAAGTTVDEYKRRVKLVLDEFEEWKADRSAWEKKHAAKQTARPAGDGDKKAKPKAEKKAQSQPQEQPRPNPSTTFSSDTAMRTVEFPLRKGVDVKISLPRDGITMAELKKLAWFLLPYASDFDPEVSPRDTFPMLERDNSIHTQ